MPDGCKVVGKNRLIRVKTPFDYILIYQGMSVYLDCKSFDSDRITNSQITEHQLESLLRIEESGGIAGYLIYFRPAHAICFCRATDLAKIKPGSSLPGFSMVILGSIEDFTLGRLFSLNWEAR